MTLDPATLALISMVFLIGGTVKGLLGFGLPVVVLALFSTLIGLTEAMALMLIPVLVTNVVQGLLGPALAGLVKRFWTYFLPMCAGVWFGTGVLVTGNLAILSALLGVLLVAYAGFALSAPQFTIPARLERWLSPPLGFLNGIIAGLTGAYVVPGGPYMQALGLKRDDLIQALGLFFATTTLALIAALYARGLLSVELGLGSLSGLPAALVGLWLGTKLRKRLNEVFFRKVFLISMILMGVVIVVRALS